MSFEDEFATVELLKESSAETRGVDAFALSLIKAERQIRKLVTHLVFQFPCFSGSEVSALKEKLADNRRVYFEGMINGFNAIYPITVEVVVGQQYQTLQSKISEAIQHRNKIFHGQLTSRSLSRDDLFSYIDNISEWCRLLASGAQNEIGYNGFTRNSFQKSKKNDIHTQFKVSLQSVEDYEAFIRENMQRP
ncbi:hypothetical protein [Sedimenticola selenatireducens]|uniref:hypothetical protein n=1 Tax=Sedimenticola selenatireducens TaxID=191960 RepID=UPI002AAB16FA|nr:hypothetical protein [Sedimenticola selenatireducens]